MAGASWCPNYCVYSLKIFRLIIGLSTSRPHEFLSEQIKFLGVSRLVEQLFRVQSG